MKKSTAVWLALVVSVFAIAVPVWLAIVEARRQGLEAETKRTLGYARDIVHRSDAAASQAANAINALSAAQGTDPCSDQNLALMRQFDLASSYLQAIGYVENGQVICSSLGRNVGGLVLGVPDFTTSRGVKVYRQLHFPFAPGKSFIALELKSYVAIIHKDLPIDVTTSENNVSLAIYLLNYGRPLSSRGYTDRAWLDHLGSGHEATFSDGNYVIAVSKSQHHLTVAVAAVPANYLASRTQQAAMRLVPAGIVAGIVLVAAILLMARTQIAMPALIRAGLKRDEFYLLYQPVVDLKTNKWVGVEALLRWRLPTGELMNPDFFIPLAEETELILQITKHVLTLIARDAGDYLRTHPGFHVAVNLSAADLHSPELSQHFMELLAKTGLSPGSLIAEITERSLLEIDKAREAANVMHRNGFCIAIDDFGTGYSSLSYLQTLKLDFLKIDKSFVEAIATAAPTKHVVQHIIAMAKDLEFRMIAEGIETEAQAEYLRERGVELGQGWLFAKAMRFSDIEHHMANQSGAQRHRREAE